MAIILTNTGLYYVPVKILEVLGQELFSTVESTQQRLDQDCPGFVFSIFNGCTQFIRAQPDA